MDEESTVDPRNRRLAPTEEEIRAWAEREHARRQAWLEGPTRVERDDWARRSQKPDDIEAWAERERGRRRAWLEGPEGNQLENQSRREWVAGPTEQEKSEWAQRQVTGFLGGRLQLPAGFEDEKELLSSLAREAELAARGSLSAVWSYLVRAGRSWEGESGEPPRRSRVPY